MLSLQQAIRSEQPILFIVAPYSAGLAVVRHALAEKGTTVILVLDEENRLYGRLTSADVLKWALGADEAKAGTGDMGAAL